MTKLFAAVLVMLGVGALAGCTTPAVRPAQTADTAALEEARQGLNRRVQEVRARAWQTATEIADLYDHIPADQCPGVAALVRDIRTAAARVQPAGGGLHLEEIDPARLATNNPHFWQAALEISPSDGSFLLLHATLLAAGGEIWRADRILTAATQMLPLPASIRPFFLTHSYGLGSVVLLSVRATGSDGREDTSPAALQRLEASIEAWPGNAVALSGVIDARIRLRALRDGGLGKLNWEHLTSVVEQGLSQAAGEVDRLCRVDPVMGAAYRRSAEERRQGRELRSLWTRMADEETVLGFKEIGELGAALEAAGAPELGLVLLRLQIVARGFPAPADALAWRRMLPRLIEKEQATSLLAAAERGDINVVELNHGQLPRPDEWTGDPAIHPLVMRHAQRQLADLSFQIEMLRDAPEAQAQVLRQRAIQASRAGLFDAALRDVEEAVALAGRRPEMLAAEAVVLGSSGRIADAERVLDELEHLPNGRSLAQRERAIVLFSQGDFAGARHVLRAEADANPDEAYAAIMAELAARRVGASEIERVNRARNQTENGSWENLCLAYLAGKISDDRLIAEAQNGDTLEVAQRHCEAYFILAQVAMAAGEEKRGLDYLESCIGTGVTGYVEFRIAKSELKRRAPEREERTRLWEKVPEETVPSRPSDHTPRQEGLPNPAVPA